MGQAMRRPISTCYRMSQGQPKMMHLKIELFWKMLLSLVILFIEKIPKEKIEDTSKTRTHWPYKWLNNVWCNFLVLLKNYIWRLFTKVKPIEARLGPLSGLPYVNNMVPTESSCPRSDQHNNSKTAEFLYKLFLFLLSSLFFLFLKIRIFKTTSSKWHEM